MNLLVKKFGQTALVLWFAWVLISCEDPGKIGLNLDADNGVVSTHYTEVVLPATMVQFDPRVTMESSSIQAGSYTDPNFGIITSKSYTQLNISSFVTDIDSTAVYDGFDLEIGFLDLYGDEPKNDEISTIELFQLSEDIDTLAQYTRLSELTTNPLPLGTWNFEPMIQDTLRNDSIYQVPLDDVVGQDLFDKLLAGDPIFDNNNSFNAYFKGIALVSANTNNVFYINSAFFKLVIKYHELNSDSTEIEKTFNFNSGQYGFFHIDSDLTGTPLAGMSPDNTDFDPGDGLLYSQLGVLTALKIDFNAFYDITDTLENMVINKAEIAIGDLEPMEDFKPPPAIMQVFFTDVINRWPIKTKDGAAFIQLQEEIFNGAALPPGFYGVPANIDVDKDTTNTQTARYTIPMSIFLQNLYAGNYNSADTPLEPEATVYFYPATDVITPQELPGYKFSNQYVVNKDSIKLKMYYTVPTTTTGNN